MNTAVECRKLALEYRGQASNVNVTRRKAAVLVNISKSLNGLASQYEILHAITEEEHRSGG